MTPVTVLPLVQVSLTGINFAIKIVLFFSC
jgi:hypothetical protein